MATYQKKIQNMFIGLCKFYFNLQTTVIMAH